MATTTLPTAARLRKLLNYDPVTGKITWKPRSADEFAGAKRAPGIHAKIWNSKHAGKPALSCVKANGYFCGAVDNLQLLQHRVIWKLMTGEEPEHIDHINGNPQDNRWDNLRSVPRVENMRNMRKSRANTSGRTGVYKVSSRWIAKGNIRKKGLSLGSFATFEEAAKAREDWERRQDYHPNHGVRE